MSQRYKMITKAQREKARTELDEEGASTATRAAFRRFMRIYNKAMRQKLSKKAAFFALDVHRADSIDRFNWVYGTGDQEPKGRDRYKWNLDAAIDKIKDLVDYND